MTVTNAKCKRKTNKIKNMEDEYMEQNATHLQSYYTDIIFHLYLGP